MKPRQALGLVLGLAGVGALLWSTWGLLDLESCGDDFQAECPPEANKYFVAMFAGIPLIVVAGFLGHGAAAVPLLVPAFGGLLVAKAFLDRDPSERTPLLVVGGILVGLALLGLAAVRRSFRRRGKAMSLMETGSTARGRVVGVRDTGVTINDDPRVEITFDVDPIDGTPGWQGTKKMTVSRVRPPREGEVWPVWYDPASPQDTWAVGMPDGSQEIPDHVWREFGITPSTGRGETDGRLDALERLGRLRDQGVLTDREFEAEKARLLSPDGF